MPNERILNEKRWRGIIRGIRGNNCTPLISNQVIAKHLFRDQYLFTWPGLSEQDKERLFTYLWDDFGLDWVEGAEISQSNGNMLKISNDEDSVEIVLDKGGKKAILGRSGIPFHVLRVREENDKLNIYRDHNVIQAWAKYNEFPLADKSDLSRVAQFLRVDFGRGLEVKQEYLDFLKRYLLQKIGPPQPAAPGTTPNISEKELFDMTFSELAIRLGYFDPKNEPNNYLHILASLPIPIYLTTSYHSLIEASLEAVGKKPQSWVYQWWDQLRVPKLQSEYLQSEYLPNPEFEPTKDNPLVYHVLGIDAVPDSLVLTEDNYFEFLENVLADLEKPDPNRPGGIPPKVRDALSSSALLLLGYNLYDWDFRAVFRGTIKTLFTDRHPPGFMIQLEAESDNSDEREKVQEYLEGYFFREYNFYIYWGSAQSFSQTLQEYCKKYGATSPQPVDKELLVKHRKQRTAGPTVFVSYSHKDEQEKEKLLSHLGVLEGVGLIDVPWSDDQILAGADWEKEIDEAIAKAQVAILLITDNFLTSKFILQKEVPTVLKRRADKELIVFPVIAKDCAWETVDWLKKINVRPKNGRPVWSDQGSHVNEDLATIAREVKSLLKDKRSS